MNCFNLLKFLNPALTYLVSRYFTYGIQFLNSILIALYLGPQQLGIWGFIILIIQYITQFNLGISHSVNTIGAINKQKVKYVSLILGNAVIMIGFLSFFWLILLIINLKFNLNFGNKYHFTQYSILVLIIAITSYYNNLFLNILRIYSKINLISFIQSIFPFSTLIALCTLNHNGLLLNLVKVYAITSSGTLLLALLTLPIKVHINFKKKVFLLIQQKGWHLFIYNTSFYLISLTTRSFVSYYYLSKEFGFFSFAFSFATALTLFLDSISFLIWPKLLNRLSAKNNGDNYKLINYITINYTRSVHGFVYLSFFFVAYLLKFIPTYENVFHAFVLIALSQAILSNSFGYQALLISKGFEKKIGIISFGIMIFNVLMCYAFFYIFTISYDLIVFSNILSYILFSVIIITIGNKYLSINHNILQLVNSIFQISLMPAFITSILLILFNVNSIYFIIPFILFTIFNHDVFRSLYYISKNIITKHHFFEI